MVFQMERNQILTLYGKKLQMLPNLVRISHTESRMRFTKINQPLVIHENVSIRRLASPVNGVDCIRALIAVVHSLFVTHHFLSGIDKRDTLRSKDYRLRQFIKTDKLFGSNPRHTRFQSVCKA